MTTKSHRVVIRRPASHEEERHGGSWKIAYADFMTAMMAFFLVMWLLTLIPREDLPGIAEYFRRPLFTFSPSQQGDTQPTVIPGGSPTVIPNPSGTNIQTPNVEGSSNDNDGKRDERAERAEKRQLEDLKTRLETLIATNPRLQEFRPQMVLDMTPEGLRIQIVDGQNKPMFDLGSANMRQDMHTILTELASTLNSLPNQLSIAGHTDATRYASGERAYSNWELSSDRANAARRSLVAGGLAENKVQRIMGLSSNMGASDDPYNHANRRISIVVLNTDSAEKMRNTYSTVVKPDAVSSMTVAPSTIPVFGWPGARAVSPSELLTPIADVPDLPTLPQLPDFSWTATQRATP